MATEGGFVAKSAILLAKAETTAGTDPTPVVGTDAVIAYEVEVNPLGEAESFERAPILSDAALGRQTPVPGKRHATASFRMPLTGTGDTGSEGIFTPDWDPIAAACGLVSSYVASPESITYEEDASTSTCTIYFLVGPAQTTTTNRWMRFEMNGCAGNVKIVGNNGEPPMLEFELMGTYVEPVDIADPGDPTLNEVTANPLLGASFALGGGFSSPAYSPVLTTFEFDLANSVVMREDMNAASGYKAALNTDRAPSLTWSMELDLVGNLNIANLWTAGTAGTVSIGSIGATAGNIVDIDFNRVGLTSVNFTNNDGILFVECESTPSINVESLATKAVTIVIT